MRGLDTANGAGQLHNNHPVVVQHLNKRWDARHPASVDVENTLSLHNTLPLLAPNQIVSLQALVASSWTSCLVLFFWLYVAGFYSRLTDQTLLAGFIAWPILRNVRWWSRHCFFFAVLCWWRGLWTIRSTDALCRVQTLVVYAEARHIPQISIEGFLKRPVSSNGRKTKWEVCRSVLFCRVSLLWWYCWRGRTDQSGQPLTPVHVACTHRQLCWESVSNIPPLKDQSVVQFQIDRTCC